MLLSMSLTLSAKSPDNNSSHGGRRAKFIRTEKSYIRRHVSYLGGDVNIANKYDSEGGVPGSFSQV